MWYVRMVMWLKSARIRMLSACCVNKWRKRCLGKAKLYTLQLWKLNRPSTYSYIMSSKVEKPLTPSYPLTGRRVMNLPDNLGYIVESGDDKFVVDAKYLTILQELHKITHLDCLLQPLIAIGDVVVVHDNNLPRGLLKLGRFQDTIAGWDGSAVVKVSSQNPWHSLLRQPIQPTEVCIRPEVPVSNVPELQTVW